MGELLNQIKCNLGISTLELSEHTSIDLARLGEILTNEKLGTKEELGQILFFLQSKFTKRKHQTREDD